MNRSHPANRTIQFPDRSDFDGLARRQVSSRDLLGHSLAALTPSLSALGTGLALPTFVGPGFWISTILGFGFAWLLAHVFDEFASRMNSPGSLYTYTAKGLGPTPALIVGAAIVVGYGVLIAFGLTEGARRLTGAWNTLEGTGPSSSTNGLVILLCAALCLFCMRWGIRVSTRIAFTIEIVSLALLSAILLTWLARFGPLDISIFSLEGASAAKIFSGAAMIALLTVAFESCASLSLEAKRPLRTVPQTMRRSLLITGGLFSLANLVGTLRPHNVPLWSWQWFGAGQTVSNWDVFTLAILGLSLLALALSAWTSLARLLFSFAREGIVWRAMGRTDRRGVPTVAMWCVVPLVLIVPLGRWATGGDPTTVSINLLHSATLTMCVAYGLVAVALVPFLRSLDELRPQSVVLSVLSVAGVCGVAFDRVTHAWEHQIFITFVIVGGALAVGIVWRLVLALTHPTQVSHLGAHDQTLSTEVLHQSHSWDLRSGPQ